MYHEALNSVQAIDTECEDENRQMFFNDELNMIYTIDEENLSLSESEIFFDSYSAYNDENEAEMIEVIIEFEGFPFISIN